MRRLVLLLLLTATATAGVTPERLVRFFSPLPVEHAALSSDGLRLAYTQREGDDLFVVVVPVDAPEQVTAHIKIADRAHSERRLVPNAALAQDKVYLVGRVEWLEWISPTRVAVATNRWVGMSSTGEIYVFNFDGTDARVLYTARSKENLNVRSIHPGNPHELVVKVWRDEHLAINLQTGKPRPLRAAELAEIAALKKQRERPVRDFEIEVRKQLTALLPGHKFTFLPSLESQTRALVRAQSVADPGGFLIYEPATRRLWDFVRRADPTLRLEDFRTEQFSFTQPAGRIFSGFLTLPRDPRVRKAPLILFVPEKLGAKVTRDYWPEVHALAAMGFAVAAVDGWHASNGRPHTEKVSAPDEFRHQLEALDVLAEHYPVSRKNVALFGQRAAARRGFQFVAAHPERFRCLVAINPDSFYLHLDSLQTSYRQHPHPPVSAVQVFSGKLLRSPAGDESHHTRSVAQVKPNPIGVFDPHLLQVTAELRRRGTEVSLEELRPKFSTGAPEARAAAFAQIEPFLNAHLYRYSVELGEIESLATDVPLPRR